MAIKVVDLCHMLPEVRADALFEIAGIISAKHLTNGEVVVWTPEDSIERGPTCSECPVNHKCNFTVCIARSGEVS